jgi:DNA polymerase delta subunit 2
MLEDESGRLQLTGQFLTNYLLCTGCIIAVLGTENRDGAFEVIEVKFADLPPQPERWSLVGKLKDSADGHSNGVDAESEVAGKIAIVSGLEIDGSSGDTLVLDMLAEYLLGEAGDDQETPRISRLILAGNSFCDSSPIPTRVGPDNFKRSKRSILKLSTDPASYNAAPSVQLDAFVSSLLPSLPVTILPGASDPVSVSLPQQPLHPAFFQRCRTYSKLPLDKSAIPSWFDSVSNPWEGEIDGWRFLVTGGQPVNDMFKYIEGNDRLGMMESFLRWRNVAPTAPDTLCK